ncbi:hypothetical protein [Pyxidicoccus parkwayensis]|uniref:hypothetical protein n=1 Tax=Pyxidicoccus parkwayensis TaxID=2813578 RepID=UPI001F50572A|nr:hypothetical protein [Pyxidicoccus parkwaysis]
MSSPSTAPVHSLSSPAPEAAPERFTLHAWSRALRGLAVAAHLVLLGSLLFFSSWLAYDIFTAQNTLTPGPLVQGLGLGVPLPLLLLAVLRWRARATVEVEATHWALTLRGGARMEIPHEAVESLRPWKLPLPGPGLTLRMKSGRDFAYGLHTENAVPLLAALGRHGLSGTPESHPLVRYAQARHALWRRRWYNVLGRLFIFPMLPAGIIFQLNQRITYGSPFGEYQVYGLVPYLRSFGRDYSQVFINFFLCACFLRALVEAVSLAAAWLTPSYARGVRRGAEWLNRLAYYVGLMALLAVRLLTSY